MHHMYHMYQSLKILIFFLKILAAIRIEQLLITLYVCSLPSKSTYTLPQIVSGKRQIQTMYNL